MGDDGRLNMAAAVSQGRAFNFNGHVSFSATGGVIQPGSHTTSPSISIAQMDCLSDAVYCIRSHCVSSETLS